jgi:AmmeMemoRadiSam system protein B
MTMHYTGKSILFKIFALGNIIAVMLLMSACVFNASAASASLGPVSEASAPADPKTADPADADFSSATPSPAALADRQPGKGGPGISTLRCIHFNEKDFRNSIALTGDTSGDAGIDASEGAGNPGADSSAGVSGGIGNQVAGSSSSANGRPDTGMAEGRNASDGADNADYPEGTIAGGVVPHHLLAGKMIARFFRTLSESPPDTIVIIGPNHKRIGMNKLHTSSFDWATTFGILETDREITGSLINELGASENTELMETEHSISSLVPYISYYMPKTRIVPILLHGSCTAAESQKLGGFLAGIVRDNPGIAVVASIDFSHYLDADTADKMDKITLDAVISRDTASISRMGNDNIDSPPSILALLSTMDEIGAIGPEITAHDNSFGISGSGAECTTSYFTMFFRRP